MKKLALFSLLIGLVFFAVHCSNTDTDTSLVEGIGFTSNSLNSNSCEADLDLLSLPFCANNSDNFCPTIPREVTGLGLGYTSVLKPAIQPHFDLFGWQAFTALNWPTTGKIGENPNAKRVWETYVSADELMNKQTTLRNQFATADPNKKHFYILSKNPDGIELHNLFQIGEKPLIDKNLNFVIYEKRVNPTQADFIRTNKLTSKQGIINYYNEKDTILLPRFGEDLEGSIEVKASWRILDTLEYDRYYNQPAVIHVPALNSTTGNSFNIDTVVGLVGMHMIIRTTQFRDGLWITFEHEDNVPESLQNAQNAQNFEDPSDTSWSFYNPNCLTCPVNTPPAYQDGDAYIGADGTTQKHRYRFDPTPPYAKRYATVIPGEHNEHKFGTQVTRTYPIYACTEALNAHWQAKFESIGSVFANYKLISNQWNKVDGTFIPPNIPFKLANTTMETYDQLESSCIGCHNFASIKNPTTGKNFKTDFSFILSGAK